MSGNDSQVSRLNPKSAHGTPSKARLVAGSSAALSPHNSPLLEHSKPSSQNKDDASSPEDSEKENAASPRHGRVRRLFNQITAPVFNRSSSGVALDKQRSHPGPPLPSGSPSKARVKGAESSEESDNGSDYSDGEDWDRIHLTLVGEDPRPNHEPAATVKKSKKKDGPVSAEEDEEDTRPIINGRIVESDDDEDDEEDEEDRKKVPTRARYEGVTKEVFLPDVEPISAASVAEMTRERGVLVDETYKEAGATYEGEIWEYINPMKRGPQIVRAAKELDDPKTTGERVCAILKPKIETIVATACVVYLLLLTTTVGGMRKVLASMRKGDSRHKAFRRKWGRWLEGLPDGQKILVSYIGRTRCLMNRNIFDWQRIFNFRKHGKDKRMVLHVIMDVALGIRCLHDIGYFTFERGKAFLHQTLDLDFASSFCFRLPLFLYSDIPQRLWNDVEGVVMSMFRWKANIELKGSPITLQVSEEIKALMSEDIAPHAEDQIFILHADAHNAPAWKTQAPFRDRQLGFSTLFESMVATPEWRISANSLKAGEELGDVLEESNCSILCAVGPAAAEMIGADTNQPYFVPLTVTIKDTDYIAIVLPDPNVLSYINYVEWAVNAFAAAIGMILMLATLHNATPQNQSIAATLEDAQSTNQRFSSLLERVRLFASRSVWNLRLAPDITRLMTTYGMTPMQAVKAARLLAGIPAVTTIAVKGIQEEGTWFRIPPLSEIPTGKVCLRVDLPVPADVPTITSIKLSTLYAREEEQLVFFKYLPSMNGLEARLEDGSPLRHRHNDSPFFVHRVEIITKPSTYGGEFFPVYLKRLGAWPDLTETEQIVKESIDLSQDRRAKYHTPTFHRANVVSGVLAGEPLAFPLHQYYKIELSVINPDRTIEKVTLFIESLFTQYSPRDHRYSFAVYDPNSINDKWVYIPWKRATDGTLEQQPDYSLARYHAAIPKLTQTQLFRTYITTLPLIPMPSGHASRPKRLIPPREITSSNAPVLLNKAEAAVLKRKDKRDEQHRQERERNKQKEEEGLDRMKNLRETLISRTTQVTSPLHVVAPPPPPPVAGPSQPTKAKACAECRRLKKKCDGLVPCGNCIKGDKKNLCPDGTMLPKKQRIALLSTPELPSKIQGLVARGNELEVALTEGQEVGTLMHANQIPSSTYAPPTVPSSSTPSRCAECRRRKIKCDRKIPCGNCVKTGKQDMCPDGDMGTKKERVAFFKTPNLPSKLEGLVARVDTLEAAFHGNASNPTSTLFQGMEDSAGPIPSASQAPVSGTTRSKRTRATVVEEDGEEEDDEASTRPLKKANKGKGKATQAKARR